jgi:hypothetical protein
MRQRQREFGGQFTLAVFLEVDASSKGGAVAAPGPAGSTAREKRFQRPPGREANQLGLTPAERICCACASPTIASIPAPGSAWGGFLPFVGTRSGDEVAPIPDARRSGVAAEKFDR